MFWLRWTIRDEVAGGLALFLAAAAAILVVNFGDAEAYKYVNGMPLLGKDIHGWINDGLMVLFFVLIGIELRREMVFGALKTWKEALSPVTAALGGALVPVWVYLLVTGGVKEWHGGSTVPMATDTAFVLALAAMLGPRMPASLRVFLLVLAVADDLLAIGVIALVFSAKVVWANVVLALGLAALLVLKNRGRYRILWVYGLVGLAMWLWVLHSGVHTTLVGVMVGMLLPLEGRDGRPSMADVTEHKLGPWVRWFILPVFAFANMGVPLGGVLAVGLHPITLGIAGGLFVGKQVGICGMVWLLEWLKLAGRPKGASWRQVYGAACLCGVGFTMSLFMASLALPHYNGLQDAARLGVLLGSCASALMGYVVLGTGGKR